MSRGRPWLVHRPFTCAGPTGHLGCLASEPDRCAPTGKRGPTNIPPGKAYSREEDQDDRRQYSLRSSRPAPSPSPHAAPTTTPRPPRPRRRHRLRPPPRRRSSSRVGHDVRGAVPRPRPAGASAAPSFDTAGFTCATGSLRSSGSTAQGNVMAAWITAYNAKCNATINDYGGGGSGKGVSDFIANQTDFGGSDSAMTTAQLADAKSKRCANNDAIDLPMVTGPIAVAYNLERRRQAGAEPDRAGKHLRRQGRQVERPIDRGAEQRRHPARPGDLDDPPRRRTRAPPTTSPST